MNNFDFIKSLIANAQIDNSRMLDLIAGLTDNNLNEILRLVAYVTGYSELPVCPHMKEVKGEKYILESFNFFTNMVYYRHTKTRTVYLYKDEVDKVCSKVYDCYYDVPNRRASSDDTVQTEVRYYSSDSMSFDEWVKNED